MCAGHHGRGKAACTLCWCNEDVSRKHVRFKHLKLIPQPFYFSFIVRSYSVFVLQTEKKSTRGSGSRTSIIWTMDCGTWRRINDHIYNAHPQIIQDNVWSSLCWGMTCPSTVDTYKPSRVTCWRQPTPCTNKKSWFKPETRFTFLYQVWPEIPAW